jgi:hypothetical protein
MRGVAASVSMRWVASALTACAMSACAGSSTPLDPDEAPDRTKAACTPGLRVPSEVPTVQAAVDAAQDGAVVCVEPGEYVETVVVARSVRLQGAQAAVPATSPKGARRENGRESVIRGSVAALADGAVVDGFTVVYDGTGVRLSGWDAAARNNVILGSEVRPSSGESAGIRTEAAVPSRPTRFRVDDNWVEGGRYGIWLGGDALTDDSVVRRNTVRDAERGVQTSPTVAGEHTLSWNHLEAVTVGLRLAQGGHTLVGNVVRRLAGSGTTPAGVRATTGPQGLTMHRNVLAGGLYGVYLDGAEAPCELTCNDLTDQSGASLFVHGSPGATVDATFNWWGQPTGPKPWQIVPDDAVVLVDPYLGSPSPRSPNPCPRYAPRVTTQVADPVIRYGEAATDVVRVAGDATAGVGGSGADGGFGRITPTGTAQVFVCADTSEGCGPSRGEPVGEPVALASGTSTDGVAGAVGVATAAVSFLPEASGLYQFYAQYSGDAWYGASGDDGENESFQVAPAATDTALTGPMLIPSTSSASTVSMTRGSAAARMTATVRGGPIACEGGANVVFEAMDVATGHVARASATADAHGVASAVVPLERGEAAPEASSVMAPSGGAVHEVSVWTPARDLAGSAVPECLGSRDVLVAVTANPTDPAMVAFGGGEYAVVVEGPGGGPPGTPRAAGERVRFGFIVRSVGPAHHGVLDWVDGDRWRLKGTISRYTPIACPEPGTTCAEIAGVGLLFANTMGPADGFAEGGPTPSEASVWGEGTAVAFTALARDGAADGFGLRVDGVDVEGESLARRLTAGAVTVK